MWCSIFVQIVGRKGERVESVYGERYRVLSYGKL